MSATRQFCTFMLGNEYFGVDVRQVQEVLRFQEQTLVPLAPPVIRGLINLRGQIVTAIDLRCRLGLDARTDDRQPTNVVVRTTDGPVSLLVDEIGEVVEVADSDFEKPPVTIQGAAGELIIGAYKLTDRLLLILDVEKTLDLDLMLAHQAKPT